MYKRFKNEKRKMKRNEESKWRKKYREKNLKKTKIKGNLKIEWGFKRNLNMTKTFKNWKRMKKMNEKRM